MDAVRRLLDTNLFGYLHGARAALPVFREQGSGVLINNGSVLSAVSQPYVGAYVLSKHAINLFNPVPEGVEVTGGWGGGWWAMLRQSAEIVTAAGIGAATAAPRAAAGAVALVRRLLF